MVNPVRVVLLLTVVHKLSELKGVPRSVSFEPSLNLARTEVADLHFLGMLLLLLFAPLGPGTPATLQMTMLQTTTVPETSAL